MTKIKVETFIKALKQEQLAVKFGPAPRKTTSTSAPTAPPSTVRQMPAFHNHALNNKIQETVLRKSSRLKGVFIHYNDHIFKIFF